MQTIENFRECSWVGISSCQWCLQCTWPIRFCIHAQKQSANTDYDVLRVPGSRDDIHHIVHCSQILQSVLTPRSLKARTHVDNYKDCVTCSVNMHRTKQEKKQAISRRSEPPSFRSHGNSQHVEVNVWLRSKCTFSGDIRQARKSKHFSMKLLCITQLWSPSQPAKVIEAMLVLAVQIIKSSTTAMMFLWKASFVAEVMQVAQVQYSCHQRHPQSVKRLFSITSALGIKYCTQTQDPLRLHLERWSWKHCHNNNLIVVQHSSWPDKAWQSRWDFVREPDYTACNFASEKVSIWDSCESTEAM